MSAYTVAGMLADLLLSQPTPAKTANPAKPRISIDSAADNGTCEGLRKVANLPTDAAAPEPDSQKFAALRNPPCTPQSEHPCGSSQLSQLSQGLPWTNASARPYRLAQADADAVHAELWDDAVCGRFVARVSLFLRRGIDATDADDLAERLHLRDVQGDDRRLCLECSHLAGAVSSGWRCGNARAAGVGRELPRELVTLMQRCPGADALGGGANVCGP